MHSMRVCIHVCMHAWSVYVHNLNLSSTSACSHLCVYMHVYVCESVSGTLPVWPLNSPCRIITVEFLCAGTASRFADGTIVICLRVWCWFKCVFLSTVLAVWVWKVCVYWTMKCVRVIVWSCEWFSLTLSAHLTDYFDIFSSLVFFWMFLCLTLCPRVRRSLSDLISPRTSASGSSDYQSVSQSQCLTKSVFLSVMYVYIYIYACMDIYMYACTYVYIYIHNCICIYYIFTYVHIYMTTQIYMHICIYKYIYI